MPTIKRFQLDGWQSVTERLHAAAFDLLPEEMAEHPVVKWVANHDALHRWRQEDQYANEMDDLERYGVGAMIGRLVAAHLQQRLPFYFASLFHIGRMQSVSRYCRQNIESLLLGKNFDASTGNLANLLSVKTPNSRENALHDAEAILRALSTAAMEHTSVQQRLATNWWAMWVQEAGALQRAVNQVDDAWRSEGRSLSRGYGATKLLGAAMRTIIICETPSNLAAAMSKSGVRLKPSVDVPTDSMFSGMASLFLVFAGLDNGRGDWDVHDLRHLMHEFLEEERERRMQPEVQIALDILRRKYGAGNPFDEYLPLCRAATPELRVLVNEHELPGCKPSPWRANWEARLEPEYCGNSYNPLRPPSSTGEHSLDWAARMADSTIKRHIKDKIAPTETWDEFIQRLYDKKCIEDLGEGAGGANCEAGNKFTIWTVESFSAYVQALTDRLNAHGYVLVCPSGARLETLIKKATKGESLYEEDSW